MIKQRMVVRKCSHCHERKLVRGGKSRRNQFGMIKFTCFDCELEMNENISAMLGDRIPKGQ